jgi:diacylglycerol kinase family enzyme
MWHYMRGKHAAHPDLFSHQRAKKVFVISDSPLMLDLDGEVFYDKYITVEIKPGVVRIIAPSPAGAGSGSGART